MTALIRRCVLLCMLCCAYPLVSLAAGTSPPEATAAQAFEAHQSDVLITGEGVVFRVLRDDTRGDQHQRFILRLADGQTLLVAHNIDLAPRLDGLKRGATVRFRGEYVWNAKGGVLHWTHHDPRGRHPGGFLEYDGRRYQ